MAKSYSWWDTFRIWTYAWMPGPLDRARDPSNIAGAGVTQPDVRIDASMSGENGLIRLSSSANELVDLSSVTNRQSRYKEYERLRNVAEIENCMTVFSDEACLQRDTKIATPFGFPTIKWLAENKADERFLVYCWDFDKQDFTLGWAYNPRKVRIEKTYKVTLEDGTFFIATAEHLVLKKDQEWVQTGNLKYGDELMAFYKIPACHHINKLKFNQFPRVYTHHDGWTHERAFIDKWRTNRETPDQERAQKAIRILSSGLGVRKCAEIMKMDWKSIDRSLRKCGFTSKEVKWLANKPKYRRVIDVEYHMTVPVYDLSVENHKNFCTDCVVVHNCQKDDDGNVLKVKVDDLSVKKEAEYFLYKLVDINRHAWNWFKNLCIYGDAFFELIMDLESPTDGIIGVKMLPPDTMYRIETTKGRVVEFQQGKEGPDYESLRRVEVTQATDADLMQATAIRFAPHQIVHMRLNEDRKTFYPYGVSLIEPARGPAHVLRMVEDAMLVYRQTRAPERRIFYIDVGNIPPYRAEAFIDRMKDQYRKRKTTRPGGLNAASVEERWHAPSVDEDYWVPIRPNSGTRIDTLPGAQNLDQIADIVYFRDKVYIALNFPKNYFNQEDVQQTRITLSAQDVRFARLIERLQSSMEVGIWNMVTRHLSLRGFPEDSFEDLTIKMTPPSDWRRLSRAEVVSNMLNEASTYKSSMLMSDLDIYERVFDMTEDEAKQIQSRMTVQKLQDLRLQIIANNPELLGVGLPGQGQPEIGTEQGGPTPDLMGGQEGAPPEGTPPGSPPIEAGMSSEEPGTPGAHGAQQSNNNVPIPEPTDEDLKKYDLEIRDYSAEQDREDTDRSEL